MKYLEDERKIFEITETFYYLEKKYAYEKNLAKRSKKRKDEYPNFLELEESCGFSISWLFNLVRKNDIPFEDRDAFVLFTKVYDYYRLVITMVSYESSKKLDGKLALSLKRLTNAKNKLNESIQIITEITKLLESKF